MLSFLTRWSGLWLIGTHLNDKTFAKNRFSVILLIMRYLSFWVLSPWNGFSSQKTNNLHYTWISCEKWLILQCGNPMKSWADFARDRQEGFKRIICELFRWLNPLKIREIKELRRIKTLHLTMKKHSICENLRLWKLNCWEWMS